jgi:ABC-type antimicrobial peptide transport system permease subunit
MRLAPRKHERAERGTFTLGPAVQNESSSKNSLFPVYLQVLGMLYGVKPHDPPIIALVAVGLTAAASAACCLPAATAARIDPVVALRQE